MLSFLIMFLGLGLVIWSLYSIRRDIEKGNLELTKGLSGVSDKNLEKIIYYLDELEKQMNDMNAAFYDLVSDLEGSYSVHDKEIELLTERLQLMEKQLNAAKTETRNVQPKKETQMRALKPEEAAVLAHLSANEPVEESYSEPEPAEPAKASTIGLTPEEANAMKQRILSLRKEGHSLSQIAKILNVGMGELQLFIKLNTK